MDFPAGRTLENSNSDRVYTIERNITSDGLIGIVHFDVTLSFPFRHSRHVQYAGCQNSQHYISANHFLSHTLHLMIRHNIPSKIFD